MPSIIRQEPPGRIGININGIKPALAVLSELGYSADQCLRDTQITLDMLEAESVTFTLEQAYQFYRNILRLTNNPLIGLQLGRAYRLESYGLLGYAMLTTKTMQQAVELAEQFFSLTFSHFTLSIISNDGLSGIAYSQDFVIAPDLLQLYIDRDLEAAVTGLFAVTQARPEIRLVKIMLDAEQQRERYESHFGCPVIFNYHRNEIWFDEKLGSMPLPQHNPLTSQLLRDQCQQLRDKLSRGTSLVDEIRNILVSSPGHFPNADEVAEQLGYNVRTLRRKLAREGSSYQSILNEIRHALAKEYLKSRISIESIAEMLGYSETASFSSAFKRWESVSPSQYRQ